MSKLEQASDEVINFINEIIMDLELDAFAHFRFFNLEKQKELIKVSKASKTTEYFAKTSDLITIFVNEKIWDKLEDKHRDLLVRNALNGISYDDEKGKMNVEQPNLLISSECYAKFGSDLVDAAEIVSHAFRQMKEEEKKKKEEAKAAKEKKQWTPNSQK